jgi:tetratricopeptide (TPR) repeat protein
LEDFNWGENKLEQALKNNPANSTYSLSLINLLINKLTFLQKTDQTADLENLFKVILSKSDLIAKRESSMIVNYLGLQQSYNAIQKLGLPLLEERKKINEKLISLDPNNPELYIDRALLNFDQYSLLKQGRLEVTNKENEMSALLKQIKADLEKSLSKKTNFVLGYFNLGLYYQELGDQVQTLANIEKAYEIDPTQKLVVLSLKKLYLNQDKADKALEILIKYLETNPKDTEVRLELAIVYKDNKDIEQAKAELNKILEIDAENQMAKEILSQLK